jgi:alcohol dehydrogenase class IV
VPHGLSNAVLLPAVTRFSLQGAVDRYAALARAMDLAEVDSSDEEAAEALVAELDALNAHLAIPRLRDLDVSEERLDRVASAMAEAALASGSPDFNPRRATADEIVALYHEIH